MRDRQIDWDRWSRASGVLFVVLAVAAFLVTGDVPKVNDGPVHGPNARHPAMKYLDEYRDGAAAEKLADGDRAGR